MGGGGILIVCKNTCSVGPAHCHIDVWSMALMLYMTAVTFLFEVTLFDNFEVLKFEIYICSTNPTVQLLSPATPPASLPDPPPTQQPNTPPNTPSKSPEILFIAGLTTAGFVLGLTVAVIVTVMCVVMIRRKSLMAQPIYYDYVEPPNLPPERVKLEGNTAYGIIQPQPLEDLSATNQITLSETVETKGNEAYGQTGVLQLQENEAYQQREVLQLQENEAYEHTREVVIYL